MKTTQPLPLAGVRVVVTRAAHQAEELCRAFRAQGAEVVALPLLEVVPPRNPDPLEDAAGRLAAFDWIVVTSANAVEALFRRASPPRSVRIAAVGRATGKALQRFGCPPALEPEDQQAEGLLEALLPRLKATDAVLLPQADDARPVLAEGLRDRCRLTAVTAYAKDLPPEAPTLARRHLGVGSPGSEPLGWVTFTSPRIVRHFVELLGDDWPRRRGTLLAASIGPVTSAALSTQGVEPAAEAANPSTPALVASVLDSLAST